MLALCVRLLILGAVFVFFGALVGLSEEARDAALDKVWWVCLFVRFSTLFADWGVDGGTFFRAVVGRPRGQQRRDDALCIARLCRSVAP